MKKPFDKKIIVLWNKVNKLANWFMIALDGIVENSWK
jgi:hypothetical protein